MNNGIILALCAYAAFSFGDATIKSLGGQLSVFEIGLFGMLFAGVFIVLSGNEGQRWRDFWRMKKPWAVQSRALSGALSGIFSAYAFTTIPLAEVYALVFLSPMFVTLLSIVFLREKVGAWRWAAIFAGFVGVMLVVRPGFRELMPGHFAALFVGLLAANTVIMSRALADEGRATIIGFLIAYAVVFNLVAALVTGSLGLPTAGQFGWLVLIGAFIAAGHYSMVMAARYIGASEMAPIHYSQIAWAVILGALFFSEYPDGWSVVGLVVIAGAGLLTFMRERVRLGSVRWNPFARRP